ncbi:metabotropic glutamate receptor 1-like [Physella acuta]|uniref:metabotropic glutamate receptor 1-like n=1 Tax=Physella acuta TaxID=109671 RepID=UPI0027DE6C9B|nr:metabotropic glutamate receptor 1-like [Physella acuta]
MLYIFLLVIFGLTLLLPYTDTNSEVKIPGLNSEVYALEGDINIGALYSITDFPVGQAMCTKKLRPESWVIEFVEATMFAVRMVNENPDILPNISLGIYIVDYCRTPNTALAKSLSFLPAEEGCNGNINSTSLTVNESRIDHYDVVGVIGTFSSAATVLVSYLYAVAQLPLVSFTATSDELSNKDNHPYFLRVVPPDVHQVKAMLKFISDNGWSFISIGYEEGSYGEKALDNVKLFADKYGICLATTQKLNSRTNFDAVVTELLRYPRARVVILFTGATTATGVMLAATAQNILGHFIWIGSDGLSDKLIYRTELAPQLIENNVISGLYSNEQPPASVCSHPCTFREYSVPKEIICCWECRTCHSNEIVVSNRTSCDTCDTFTWPDEASNYTTCIPIPLTFSTPSDTLSLIQICMAIGAILAQCLVVAAYFIYRENRVIKAASRELSILQMAGIFLGYVTVIVFQTRPTPETCSALYFMFCMSFAWLYSPLIVKTVRIFRIFESSAKYNRRPPFVSPQSQIIFASVLIFLQVNYMINVIISGYTISVNSKLIVSPLTQIIFASVLIVLQIFICLCVYVTFKPTAKKRQPVATEKLVELSCDLTLPGLVSFLAYNLVLVTLCSIFAFKTRKLPENFNESKFISMCVFTTLVIWLSFICTYFTASRESVKILLLSVALLLNHTVALVFLFLPKIYAAVYVDPETFVSTNVRTSAGQTPANVMAISNRIAPTVRVSHSNNFLRE